MNDHMAIQDIPGMSEQKSEIVENNSIWKLLVIVLKDPLQSPIL